MAGLGLEIAVFSRVSANSTPLRTSIWATPSFAQIGIKCGKAVNGHIALNECTVFSPRVRTHLNNHLV